MRVLSIVHGAEARAQLFSHVVAQAGHRLEEWSPAWGTPPPRPIDDYDATLVLGGAMHADQDEHHPWLREENMLLQRLVDIRVPTLGVCLGAQLLAKAAHAPVEPAPEPEIGWHEVELTEAAADDPIFSSLPQRFHAFQWHYYTYGVPAGAVELARSRLCTQAFRLGESVWGVQFHPEVTRDQIAGWLEAERVDEGVDVERVWAESAERIEEWNRLGERLCAAFLDTAGRAAPVSAR